MSCTCTGTTTSTGRLAWCPPSWEESESLDLWGTQDTIAPAPLLLLLPNNILVLSELQMETPASVILLRRGCTDIGGHRNLRTHQALCVAPCKGAHCCCWGDGESPAVPERDVPVGISASTGLAALVPHWGSHVCHQEPGSVPGLTLPGDSRFLLGSACDGWMDGRTDGDAAGAAQAFLLCIWWLVIGTPRVGQ